MSEPRLPSFPMSPMTGGINRYVREAAKDQFIDGLDVVNTDGELRRRPAFRSVQRAFPHIRPANQAFVAARSGAGAVTVFADRNPVVSSYNRFFIGCQTPFDCIVWGPVTLSAFAAAHKAFLRASYLAVVGGGSSLATIPFVRDTTRYRYARTADMQPLTRSGMISFHRSGFSNWNTGSANAVYTGSPAGHYWIVLEVVDQAGVLMTLCPTVTMGAPGIRVGDLMPINGLLSSHLGGTRRVIIASDRNPRARAEPGAMLCGARGDGYDGEELILVGDEGPCVYGQQTWPEWQQRNAAGTAWVDQGAAASPTRGTAGALTKTVQTYKWDPNNALEPPTCQWRGAPIQRALVPSAITASQLTIASLAALPTGFYDGFILRATAKGAGGTTVGQEREITRWTTGGVCEFYDAFGTTPDTDNRFAIIRPPARVRIKNREETELAVSSNSTHTITPFTGRPFEQSPPAALDGKPWHFEVSHRLRWIVESGDRWSFAFDAARHRYLATNGASGLMSWDGVRLRRVKGDQTSEQARLIVGVLPDDAPNANDPTPQAKSQLLAMPPLGRYLTIYQGRVVMAGIRGRLNDLAWSVPGAHNDIWPMIYRIQVRDEGNLPISGVSVHMDRLLVWTPVSIHEAVQTANGLIGSRPLALGVGAVSHHAITSMVGKGSTTTYFVGPDGFYSLVSTQPSAVIDAWDRVLEGGVNTKLLHLSMCVAMPEERAIYIGVPAAGSSAVDRILRYDVDRGTVWPWSLPVGISSMTKDVTPQGQERLLVGTNDGHVWALRDAPLEDGWAVDGYAKTPPMTPFGDVAASFQRVMVQAQSLGPAETMDVRVYVDERQVAAQDADMPFDAGHAPYADAAASAAGDTVWADRAAPAATDATFADTQYPVRPLNVTQLANGHSVQVEIGGTSRWRYRAMRVEARSTERNR